jgi:hypothetical protein
MKLRAVFACSALIVISAGGLSQNAALARSSGAKHATSTAATTSSTQTTTLKFSKKRPPRAYSGSNPQGAARGQD